MTTEFSIKVRVYIEDTDAGGIVYYVNYLKFMERARSEMLRSLGFSKPAMIADDVLLVVASCNVDYLNSAVLDDELSVTAEVEKLGKSYVVIRQEVRRDDKCLCRGTVKVACISQSERRPIAFPDAVMAGIESMGLASKK